MSDENETPEDSETPEKGKKRLKIVVGGSPWLPVGIAVGVAIGVATDNLGLWLALGVAIGAAMTAVDKKNKKD